MPLHTDETRGMLCWHSLEWNVENTDKMSGNPDCRRRFEPANSSMWSRIANHRNEISGRDII